MTSPTDQLIDDVDAGLLQDIAAHQSPWLSITLPTHRSGPEARSSATVLRQLVGEARTLLADLPDGAALLEPIEPLIEDVSFWDRQGDGLALFSADGAFHAVRASVDLPPEVSVGAARLRPLLSAQDHLGPFRILCLSRGAVRLLESTGSEVTELDLGGIPSSEEELTSDRDHQKHLQQAPQGGGEVSFHGHGGDGAAVRNLNEKFFRIVAHDLSERLANEPEAPRVLPAVEETFPVFRDIWQDRSLHDEPITGNADQTPAAELRDQARELLLAARQRDDEELIESVGARRGTGLLAEGVRDTRAAAMDGRVEVLMVAADEQQVNPQAVADPVDHAITAALRTGAAVRGVPGDLHPRDGVLALLRY